MFYPRQHDLWPSRARDDRFFRISPNHIFGALETYLDPKKNFTAMLIRSTTRMPQATADRFFRISPNCRFGALEAYFKPKIFYRNTLQIENSLLQGSTDRFFRHSPNRKFGPEGPILVGENTAKVTKWLYILVLKDLFMHFLEVLDTKKSDCKAIGVLKAKLW